LHNALSVSLHMKLLKMSVSTAAEKKRSDIKNIVTMVKQISEKRWSSMLGF
jgi:hypothetical protein